MDNKIDEKALQLNFGKQLEKLGWKEIKISDIIRDNETDVVLKDILKQQIKILNFGLNEDVLVKAFKIITTDCYHSLFDANYNFWKIITEGLYIEDNNAKINPVINFIDFKNINNNIFTFIHEYPSANLQFNKRPDTILFVNGIPISLVEFKSPIINNVSIIEAYKQIVHYRTTIPAIFLYNLFAIITDGHQARYGTIFSSEDHFMVWKKKTINDNITPTMADIYELDVLITGLLNKITLLEILKDYTIFTSDKRKIIPAYHQYYGIKKAITSIKNASDGKAGIIWHTQGSGKSLSMVFLTKKIIENIIGATIIIVTDRNNLDEQLYYTFSQTNEYYLASEKINHIESTEKLINILKDKKQGGIIFTTIQKFNKKIELLSNRKNIIVIADEAHRSQYGINGFFITDKNKQEIYEQFGYAKYLRNAIPNATFIGFTGTPIDNKEKSTYKIFGKSIDIYDMLQSKKDGNTVPIAYERQLIKVKYDDSLVGNICYDGKIFNEISQFIDYNHHKLGSEIANKTTDQVITLETIIGDQDRLKTLVTYFIKHYNNRKEQLYGKAMYVAFSRAIAYKVYKLLNSYEEFKNKVKIIISENNQDNPDMVQTVGSKKERNKWIKEFKNKVSNLKIIIVVDMLLTGFDMPILDVIYIDKPLRMHNLMQAMARVNRTYHSKDNIVKNYGLIVDFIGIKKYLEEAIKIYTSNVKSEITIEFIDQIVKKLKDKYQILCDMFYQFDFSDFVLVNKSDKYEIIKDAYEFILIQDLGNIKKPFLTTFMREAKLIQEGYKYCINSLANDFKMKLSFFISLWSFANKNIYNQHIIPSKDFQNTLSDIIDNAIISKQLITITELDVKNKINILSENNIKKLKAEYRPRTLCNMMINWLTKKINLFTSENIVKSKQFQEKLESLIASYNQISDSEVMFQNIITLNKELNEVQNSGKKLGLNPKELALYDIIMKPKIIKKSYSNDVLVKMAKELLIKIINNATVDWYKRIDVKAKMRIEINILLIEKYHYPQECYQEIQDTIIEQAEKFFKNSEAYLIS